MPTLTTSPPLSSIYWPKTETKTCRFGTISDSATLSTSCWQFFKIHFFAENIQSSSQLGYCSSSTTYKKERIPRNENKSLKTANRGWSTWLNPKYSSIGMSLFPFSAKKSRKSGEVKSKWVLFFHYYLF